MTGFTNPFHYIFDLREWNNGNLVVRHSIPYSDSRDLPEDERKELVFDKGEPLFFSNCLEDQLQGQINAGFVIVGFYEDKCGGPLDKYVKSCFATRAIKTTVE